MSVETLQKLLKFDADDLKENHEGRLSARQRRNWWLRLLRQSGNQVALMVMAALVIIFLLATAGRANVGERENSLTFVLVAVFFGMIVFAIYALRNDFKEMRQDVGAVKTIKGPVKLATESDRDGTRYLVRIGSQKFNVPKNVHAALEEGENYRLFYTENARVIVSVEQPDNT